MSRKSWIILASAVIFVALLGAAGVGGVQLYLQHRNAAWLRDALAAYNHGEWARARGYFERYLPQDPKNDGLLEKYADACLKLTSDRLGALRAASTAYQQILTYHPERSDIRKHLADLYSQLSAWSTLEYYTRDWLRRDPGDLDIVYYNALALDRMGKLDEAMKGYELLAEKNTGRSDVYGSYARILREKGLENRAEEVFAKARKARPDDGRIIADYARFLARKSTWTEVQNLLDQALKLSPDDADVLMAAAQAEMLRRQHGRAVELLRKAIEKRPGESAAYLMLAESYVDQGMVEEAIQALKGASTIVKIDSPMILIMLADLQLGMSAFDDAKATIGMYQDAYPDQLPITEYFAAKEMLVRGEPSEAVKRLASVVQLRPGFALAQYTLAEAYLASGEVELARNALESYLSKNPSDERAQRLMAQRFGRPVSIEALAARAEDLSKQEGPDRQRLLAIAASLLDSAVRHDSIAEYRDVIRAALEKSIALSPNSSTAYQILADVALLEGKPEDTLAVIDRATAQGCDANDFLLLRAGVALSKNDTDGAARIIDTATSRAGFSQGQYSQWSAFFAQHGHYDQAVSMLDRGIGHSSESEAQVTLEVERALLALRYGHVDQAAQWLEAVTPRVTPGTTLRRRFNAARLQLAQTYLVLDATPAGEQEARKLIHAVRQEDPGNEMLQVSDGLLLLRTTPPEIDRAQSLFETAAAADTTSLGAQWGLANVALARYDYPRALTHIERALSAAPNMPALRMLEASAFIKTDRLFEAERVLRRLLLERPDDIDAAQLLVTCLIERGAAGDANEAMKLFESLAVNKPGYAESIRGLGGSLRALRDGGADAEKVLRTEVTNHPGDLTLICALARAVFKQGRVDEARTLLMDYAEKRNADPSVWLAVAQWWTKSPDENQWREASTCLTRALLADPDYIPAVRAMLSIRLIQHDNLEALGLCNRYLSRNPDDADMLNTKARLLGQTPGRLQEALASADRAVELDDRPEYRGTRGVILVALRQYDRALRDLRPYAMEARDIPARCDAALAEAYFATNDLKRARQYLDRAMSRPDSGDAVDRNRLRQLREALRQKEPAA